MQTSLNPAEPDAAAAVPVSTPFGGDNYTPDEGRKMALLALSHTALEHRLYLAMHAAAGPRGGITGNFGVRRLMQLTGLSSYSSVRRGCAGLINKLSIEPVRSDDPRQRSLYYVYGPEEIFVRRRMAGLEPYPREIQECAASDIFILMAEDVVRRRELSRREALVALYCAEGLSNLEISAKLKITENTVKYHLRHIFIKLKIRRRTELVRHLLAEGIYKERKR
jgi:DNA-binding CsgD family transcriptional regulator